MMHLNLIHRPEALQDGMFETLQFQIQTTRRLGLRATNLLPYRGLLDPKVVALVKDAYERHGDEPGIHCHSYQGDTYVAQTGLRERAFWGNTQANQKRLLTMFIESFEKQFGFVPASVGSYYFDAEILAWLKATYPQVQCVIASCFNEGSVCSRGTNYNWYFFNEGGPWWPWYPSRNHVLAPAKSAAEAIDVVAIPHLLRDMIMSINDRNDYFASHPGNIIRGKAYEGPESQYDVNMIEQYAAQGRYNGGYAYYTVFVSLPWLMNSYEDSAGSVQDMYAQHLGYLAKMKGEGRLQDMTMGEFAGWFRKNREYNAPDVCFWPDILCGSKREAFWTINGSYRICIDSNLGGAVCDMRTFEGGLESKVGADTDLLWNGSYPFLLNAHKRGSSMPRFGRAALFGTVVSVGGASVNLSERRILTESYDPATQTLRLEPLALEVGGCKLRIQQEYQFEEKGLTLSSVLLEAPADAAVTVQHYLSGCVGHTEYPEDIRGVRLEVQNAESREKIEVQYLSNEHELANPVVLSAEIPKLQTRVEMVPVTPADSGLIGDEFLFSPYFNLSLRKALKAGERMTSCLLLKKM